MGTALTKRLVGPVGSLRQLAEQQRFPPTQEHLVLCLDCSGSMGMSDKPGTGYDTALDALKQAAIMLVQGSNFSSFGLVRFNESADVMARIGDRVRAVAEIGFLRHGGDTALYKGLDLAARELEGSTAQVRRIVLFSDGHATDEARDLETLSGLVGRIKSKGIIVDCVALGWADEDTLRFIATGTGGVMKQVDSTTELCKTFLQLEAKTRGLLNGRKP